MGKRNGVRLDRKGIAELASTASIYMVVDEGMPGLCLRVYPSGLKSWVLRYRAERKERLITLGQWPAMGIEKARAKATAHKKDINEGKDPVADKLARDAAPTVQDLADRFIRDHAAKKAPRTKAEYERLVNKHIVPALGPKRKVDDVTTGEIAALLDAMSDTPYQANRVRAVLGKMFSKARLWNMRTLGENPARGHEREPEPKRKRVLSDMELVGLGAVLHGLEVAPRAKAGRHRPSPVPALVRFLLLTGARVGEALELQWTDLDIEDGVWHLNKHKTVRKVGERLVALPSPAVAALKSIPVVLGNPHVFVGTRRGSHLDDPRRPWADILEKAGIHGVRIHDLRRTFGSVGIGLGIPELRIATLLGHAAGTTTQIYARVADPVQKADAERVATKIAGLLSGLLGRAVVTA